MKSQPGRKCHDIFDTSNDIFKSLEFALNEEDSIAVAPSYENIHKHYMELAEFTCKMAFSSRPGWRAELEFPIKHINISPEKRMFQIETGPVLMVNQSALSSSGKIDLLDMLMPSFVHFNRFDRADFYFDFPYGVRTPGDRGDFFVKSIECQIGLFSNKEL